MLRILGSAKTLCSGISRRDLLRIGGLGFAGLGLDQFFHAQELQAAPSAERAPRFGQAKSCILLYLYGAPSQLELCDMKPDAPVEIRGEFKSIRSRLPGCDVCELLPNMARVIDRMTVVRSMTHPYPIHGVAYATTGTPTIDVAMELSPHDGKHYPYIGSVVDYLTRNQKRSPDTAPTNIALPWPFSSHRVGEVPRAGPYAAFLGGAFHPTWTEFEGQATRSVVKTLAEQKLDCLEPYMGIAADSRFTLAKAAQLADEMTLDRLDRRRSLVAQFDAERRDLDKGRAGATLDRHRAKAMDLIRSDRVRRALDIQSEPLPLRESYGMTLFGQAALTARRLVEAGSRFVSVFWDEFGLAGSGWDTHWDHYPRMKNELLPGLDMALAGLIADLDGRGLLDETLVLCISEHGRTPKMQNVKGGGRDHWSQAYTCLFAGGGVARGNIVGKTDKIGGTVVDRPVSPKDVLATAYHLLGLDPHTILRDRLNRPVPLVDGQVVTEMLA